MLKRALAILVLVIVVVIAIRLVVGFVVGLVSALLWILVVAALVAAGLWAWSTLKGGKRRKAEASPGGDLAAPGGNLAAPADDPVAVEMARITEQLRQQGRR
jgi:hypothetical protein